MKTLAKAIVINRRFTSCAMTEVSPGIGGTASGQRGFSLIELLTVCAILGVLVTLALPAYEHFKQMAKLSRCKTDIRTLEGGISAYVADQGAKPATLSSIGQGSLKDPWGNLYEYKVIVSGHIVNSAGVPVGTPYKDIGGNENSDFDLYSVGANGLTTTDMRDLPSEDDVVRHSDGSFVDIVTEFMN